MRVEMLRVGDSGCFELPSEYNVNGVRINNIVIDNNILPPSTHVFVNPRKVTIKLIIPKDIKVYADIVQL